MAARRVMLRTVASPLAALGLAGMAYCHIKDVGMKFDEHVYYMATLFCCNIAASIALIPAVLFVDRLTVRVRAGVWAGAGALAAMTIAGFVWSRTVGFPQMEDHVGEWDTLGLVSLAFEALVVAVSAGMLADLPRDRSAPSPMIGAGS